MRMDVKRAIGATAVVVALLGVAACSDDGDESADAGTEQASEQAAGSGAPLTRDDLEAFTAAAQAGTTEGPDYVACLADEVKAAVDAGELTADDVRAWIDGTGFDGPVQAHISTPDVVLGCMGTGDTGASTP